MIDILLINAKDTIGKRALQKLLDCANEYKEQGDKTREANTYADMAMLYIQQGQLSQAGGYLQHALVLFDEDEAYKDFRYAYVYRTNATYLLKVKQFDTSIEFAFKSADIFDKMGIERESANSLRIAVEAYEMMGQLSKALSTSQDIVEILSRPHFLTGHI